MHGTIKTWIWLIVGSVPFLLDSAYEAYVLTPMRGPQMLYFVVAHTQLIFVVGPSALIYAASLLYVAVLLLVLLRWPKMGASEFKAGLALYLGMGIIHGGLLSTYDRWSQLFPRSL